MAEIKNWSSTASDNGASDSPDGAQTGWEGADLGPWARETMASVAKWYGDPAWVAPVRNLAGSSATVTVSSNTLVFASLSADISSLFPVGQLLQLTSAGGTVLSFVVSYSGNSSSGTLTLSNACPAGATDVDKVKVFAGASRDIQNAASATAASRPVGPMAFGGHGTETQRNDRYGGTPASLPPGIIWFNTSKQQLEYTDGSTAAWQILAATDAWSGPETTGPRTFTVTSPASSTSSVVMKEGTSNKLSVSYDGSGNLGLINGSVDVAGSSGSPAGRLVYEEANGTWFYNRKPSTASSYNAANTRVELCGLPGYTSGKSVGWYYEEDVATWTESGTTLNTVGSHNIVNDAGTAVAPRLVTVTAVATGTPTGNGDIYSTNDEVMLTSYNATSSGISVVATSTEIKYITRSQLRITGKNNNDYDLEESQWKLVFRAWR